MKKTTTSSDKISEKKETPLLAALYHELRYKHSTRPFIAKYSFIVLAFLNSLTVVVWLLGVALENEYISNAVIANWKFLLVLNVPFSTVLVAYFGILACEQKSKLGNIVAVVTNALGKK